MPTLGANQNLADLAVEHTTTTPDADYHRFGYWMVTSGTGAKLKQTIHTFADAMGYGAVIAQDVTALEGKATY